MTASAPLVMKGYGDLASCLAASEAHDNSGRELGELDVHWLTLDLPRRAGDALSNASIDCLPLF